MKLYLNAASPYARLVRVLVLETRLHAGCELHFVDPWESPPELLAHNPAARVPVLVLDDGVSLTESGCICDYLIALAHMPQLAWQAAPHPAARLRLLGLGRALLDCAFGAVVLERFSPDHALAVRWRSAIPRLTASLQELVADAPRGAPVDLADLTLAVALEYLAFRLPELGWQRDCAELAEWSAHMRERPSLAATRPR